MADDFETPPPTLREGLGRIRAAVWRSLWSRSFWASWKTNVCAGLASIAYGFGTLAGNPTHAKYAIRLSIASLIIGAFFSRDKDVDDQKAGLRPDRGEKP